jgi:hypothetical protein
MSKIKESGLFSAVDIIEYIDEQNTKLIKIKAEVKDGTSLYITELHTFDYQKYSYHWQQKTGELIMRWDNKPHWENIKTFPHHKHEKGNVFPSFRVSIEFTAKAPSAQR